LISTYFPDSIWEVELNFSANQICIDSSNISNRDITCSLDLFLIFTRKKFWEITDYKIRMERTKEQDESKKAL